MFKRKQDVDKHVLSVLNRKRDEKERSAQGYQIARLYLDIKEYETAKRYLASFLRVRENSPQAHQMMGEINEAIGKKDLAVDNYRRALDLGGFGSSNRQLVLKICELYCDMGTDDQRMKYWLQKCEELFPQSDILYRMKSQLLSSSSPSSGSNVEMEKLLLDELMNRPKDLELRIKLLHLYLDMDRTEEAYEAAVDTDLTMAFFHSLSWYECIVAVFERHSMNNPGCTSDPDFLLMNMHVLRNVTFLSLPSKTTNTSAQLMKKFDKAVKDAENAAMQEDSWLGLIKEMKGQVLYLAGLFIIKRAMMGSIQWQDANQLSGACFLACVAVSPLDAQSPWFLKPRKEYLKFYNWWYQQSNDRLSQAGHMILQLSQNDVTDWSRVIHAQIMTGSGQKRVFESIYAAGGSAQEHADDSFLYASDLMVSQIHEPLTQRQLLDIDRVAYQVHLDKLSHLVWLCLQRYSPNMDFQPNYHFNLMENIQFSVKNIETSGGENLCQLDVLTFLLASVRCAASSISDNVFSYDDQSGRPTLLPVSLSRPFCTQEQEEWWDTAFKFCSNSVKDNFSRLRRVLIRGVEVVRLKGTHGMSIPMQCHLARCFDAKVKSLKESEFGCRCSAAELSALEARALFFWEKAYDALLKFRRNQHPPAIKNRMFKEAGDGDLTARLVDKLLSETEFALALSLMAKHQYQDALERFSKHGSPWASFYSSQILRKQGEECQEAGKIDAFKSLIRKSRDSLYNTLDRLNGDKSHELNFLVSKEMDDLEVEIQGFEWDENESSGARESFYTPIKTPSLSSATSVQQDDKAPCSFSHSTPRRPVSNGTSQLENSTDVAATPSASQMSQMNGTSPQSLHSQSQQLRPSPERLDSKIKSLGYSQTTLFKMVLDRNEELVLMHSRIIEEHGNHSRKLQEALTENKKVMEDLKVILVENRDTLKGIKTEIASLKSGVLAPPSPLPASAPIPPGPQLIVAPTHLPQAPRGAYSGFPPPPQPTPGLPSYPGYLLNSPIPPGAAPGSVPAPPAAGGASTTGPNYRIPGRSSQMGKFKLGAMGGVGEEDDEEDETDDLEHTVEEFSAMYPEYFDQDYSQYYTPDSHLQDWSLRGVDPNVGSSLSMSPGIQQPAPPRMPMPQPGFFASALRGQSLQYAQQQSTSVSSQPNIPAAAVAPSSKLGSGSMIGPGFFSTPMGNNVTSAAALSIAPDLSSNEGMNVAASPLVQGNIPIFSAMSNMGNSSNSINSTVSSSQVSGLKEALSNGQGARSASNTGASSEDLGASLGFSVLFHIKALLPAKNIKGGITILRGPNNSRTTVVMMSDTEDMLFQHDAHGLVLKPITPGIPGITWTASKIVSSPLVSEKETVTIVTVPESMGNLLREALEKASTFVPDSTANSSPLIPAQTASPSAAPSLFGNASASKTEFGGFSFTSTPVLTPSTHTEREKVTPQKGTSPIKKDSGVKPFAGVSLSVPQVAASSSLSLGTTSETISPSKSPCRKDEERLEEYEPNVDFKPVIPLPELVEKKTGEENETVIFVDRCRLFRYDTKNNQWKERGVGEMKILCDNKEHRYRVVMRRDQIFKLCANHFISDSMKLSPLASSDKTWCYSAMDYSDEEMKMEQLAVKFKNTEKAKRFKDAFEDCVVKTKKGDGAKTDVKGSSITAKDSMGSISSSTSTSKPSFSFFTQSAVSSKTTTTMSKPLTTTTESSVPTSTPSADPPSVVPPPAVTKGDLSELFKPKPGSWECPSCLCRNQSEHLKCPACGKAKPGSEANCGAISSLSTSTSFSIAPGGGFTFGSAPQNSAFGANNALGTLSKPPMLSTAVSVASKAVTSEQSAKSATGVAAVPLSELFKPKAGSWDCDGCYCRNQAEHLQCPACGKRQPGVKLEDVENSVTTSSSGGFTFGSGGGFTFGSTSGPSTSTSGFSFGSPIATSTTTETSKPTGFQFPMANTGFTFGASKSPSTAVTTATSTTASTPVSSKAQPTQIFTPGKQSSADGSLLASLLTSDEPDTKPVESSGGFCFTMTPGQKFAANQAAAATNKTSNSSTGFNFNFQKSPAVSTIDSSTPTSTSKGSSHVPNSPEIDEQGLYVTKEGEDSHIHFEPIIQLPDKIETKTGEEEEAVLFESRARMYRFVSGEWKEKGVGVMKVLEHRQTKKARVLMRRDQVLKICCNHSIKSDLELQPMPKMEGKAWLWYAMDFSDEEGKMEQLAVRFKKPETAQEFKTVFDGCKNNNLTNTTPQKGKQQEAAADSDDDVIFVKEEMSPATMSKVQTSSATTRDADNDKDVVFVKEEEASPEQKVLAAKYQLPANFYLYENRKPCKGCLGCTDGEGLPPHAKKTPEQSRSYADAAKSPSKSSPVSTTPAKSIFGSNVSSSTPPLSTRTPEAPSTGVGKSVFGSHAGLDGSSIFGGTSLPNTGSPTPSIFGGGSDGSNQTKDFSSLIKGGSTQSNAAASSASPFSNFVFGAGSSTPDFSSLAASNNSPASFVKKTDADGPFKFQGAGQKLFGSSSPGVGSGEGDGDVASSADIHFEPIIPLPELVEVKTGEEDWTKVFCHRAKLFKFDGASKQWKERGIGDIKIMSYNKELMFRILQRREQVLKVSCNHLITKEMNLKPMSTSLSSWCWVANDLADEEPSVEQFAVKFKNKEIAAKFKAAFKECQAKLEEKEEQVTSTTPDHPTFNAKEETKQTCKEEEADDDDDDGYEDVDEDDDDDDQTVYEKRATLQCYANGKWKNMGSGQLCVKYNEDLNGNSISFSKDDGTKLCGHVICREHDLRLDPKTKSCEWKPLDYVTDESIRQHFKVTFSSLPAAEEFAKVFMTGKQLALDSDISEKLPTDIDVPEVFSRGDVQKN